MPITLKDSSVGSRDIKTMLSSLNEEQKQYIPEELHSKFRSADKVMDGAVRGIYEGDTLVGCLKYTVSAKHRSVNIDNFFIQREYRKKGIGGMALDLFIEEMEKRPKIQSVIIGVMTKNTSATKLYMGRGFKQFRSWYYRSPGRVHGDESFLKATPNWELFQDEITKTRTDYLKGLKSVYPKELRWDYSEDATYTRSLRDLAEDGYEILAFVSGGEYAGYAVTYRKGDVFIVMESFLKNKFSLRSEYQGAIESLLRRAGGEVQSHCYPLYTQTFLKSVLKECGFSSLNLALWRSV